MALIVCDHIGVEFINPDAGLSIYFQPGDDADNFRHEIDQYTRAFGDDYGLARLWETYAEWFDI